jgi:hypothetical protein
VKLGKLATSIVVLLTATFIILNAQGSGTPSTLRVRTDATGALMTASAVQALPLSQPTQFTNIRLRTDASGNLVIVSAGGAGAPADATYITQTSNVSLTNEQALSSLNTGIMRVATTTGVVTSLTDSAGISSNISDETGTGVLVFGTSPNFTTSLSVGTNPAASGGIRLPNNTAISGRNSSNSADQQIAIVETNNTVTIGTNGSHLGLAGGLWAINNGTGDLCANGTACTSQSFYVASKQLRIGAVTVGNVGANSCGTSAATIVGNNTAGKVTVGATAGTQCRITFSSAWTNAPACVVTNETTANLARAASTTTVVDLTGTFNGADVLSYQCLGY